MSFRQSPYKVLRRAAMAQRFLVIEVHCTLNASGKKLPHGIATRRWICIILPMKIAIINGTPAQTAPALDTCIQSLTRLLDPIHEVQHMRLCHMTVSPCTGCFGCWVKTPGQCLFRDDTHQICTAYMAADVVVFASPVLCGFTSALLKTAQDKLIPLLHPYFESVKGEVHHRKRYDTYPKLALLLHCGENTDDEDVDIITGMYHRMALNFKTHLTFVGDTRQSPGEVAHGIVAH
jgi:hypothetical protein